MSDNETDSSTGTIVKERSRTKTPKQYQVILLNDDYTTMDFVVLVLEKIFMKSPSESVQIMMQVHKNGRGLCGIYSKQIAEAKLEQVHQLARADGFPLRCIMEEV